jgi:hypothetical protein
MRRIGRYLLNFLVALSLLLCIACAVLWIRSYHVADGWFYQRVPPEVRGPHVDAEGYRLDVWVRDVMQTELVIVAGQLFVMRHLLPSTNSDHDTLEFQSLPDPRPSDRMPGLLGFCAGRQSSAAEWAWWVGAPHWFACLITALLPARFVWRRTRRRRWTAGHCRRCGYDLTANVSGICPECGATIAQASRA